jgi:hypothetical protein
VVWWFGGLVVWFEEVHGQLSRIRSGERTLTPAIGLGKFIGRNVGRMVGKRPQFLALDWNSSEAVIRGEALLGRDSSSIQLYPAFGGVGFRPLDPSFLANIRHRSYVHLATH